MERKNPSTVCLFKPHEKNAQIAEFVAYELHKPYASDNPYSELTEVERGLFFSLMKKAMRTKDRAVALRLGLPWTHDNIKTLLEKIGTVCNNTLDPSTMVDWDLYFD